MTTTIATETYNYKGLEIKRIDSLVENAFSTTTAFANREWFVGETPAHVVKIQGQQLLAFYQEGEKKVLGDFHPECGLFLSYEEQKSIVAISGKSLQSQIVEG